MGPAPELPLRRCPPFPGQDGRGHPTNPNPSELPRPPASPGVAGAGAGAEAPAPSAPSQPRVASAGLGDPHTPPRRVTLAVTRQDLPSAGARGLPDLSPRCPAGRVTVPFIADSARAVERLRAPARVTASGSQPASEAGRPARCPWPPWGHHARPARPGPEQPGLTSQGGAMPLSAPAPRGPPEGPQRSERQCPAARGRLPALLWEPSLPGLGACSRLCGGRWLRLQLSLPPLPEPSGPPTPRGPQPGVTCLGDSGLPASVGVRPAWTKEFLPLLVRPGPWPLLPAGVSPSHICLHLARPPGSAPPPVHPRPRPPSLWVQTVSLHRGPARGPVGAPRPAGILTWPQLPVGVPPRPPRAWGLWGEVKAPSA